MAEDRGQKTEVRGQRPEDRGQRTDGRGQGSDGRGQGTEVRGQKTHNSPPALIGGGYRRPFACPEPVEGSRRLQRWGGSRSEFNQEPSTRNEELSFDYD